VLNDTKFLWFKDKLIMKMKEPQVKKWILPWVLLILISAGMVGLIWREERGVAKYGYPLAASHDTAILLSNHVYGIQGVMRRTLSSGDGKWARMSLESDEYPSGIVSNVYVFPSGSRTVQVLELPGANRWFGTEYYEEIAKEDYLTRIAEEKGLGEIKAILEEFPPARESGLQYSGIHEVFVARAEFREVIRRSLLKVLNTHQVVAHKKALFATTDNSSSVLKDRVRVEQKYYQRRCHDRLKRLYGALPEAVFQRLNSVHIWGVPKPLILPTNQPSSPPLNPRQSGQREATKKIP
jgi:hypothetical protein